MQEIELQQGFITPRLDGGGIERLRFLAMQFEEMGRVKTDKARCEFASLPSTNITSTHCWMTGEDQRH
jgi:hypothetical protein